MKAEEFYQMAMHPDFADEMTFQITADTDDPEKTFSREAFDETTDQIHDFLVARTFGRYKRTGRGPKKLQAHVVLKWVATDDDRLEARGIPWYNLRDMAEGLTQVDGQNRLARRRVDNR